MFTGMTTEVVRIVLHCVGFSCKSIGLNSYTSTWLWQFGTESQQRTALEQNKSLQGEDPIEFAMFIV